MLSLTYQTTECVCVRVAVCELCQVLLAMSNVVRLGPWNFHAILGLSLYAQCRSTTIAQLTSSIIPVRSSAKELTQNQCFAGCELVKLRTYHSIKNECSMCHDPYTHILSCSHVGQWGRGSGSSTDVRVSAFIAFQVTVWSMNFKLQCFSQPSWHVSDCPILSVSLARLLSGHLVFEAHGRGSQVNVSVKLVGK